MDDIRDLSDNGTVLHGRELKGPNEPSFNFVSEVTLVTPEKQESLDTRDLNSKATFEQNYKYWNQAVAFDSCNNYNNSYFDRIVEMGEDAVPFIIEEMRKGPTPLVHALDLIYPRAVEYNGFVSLKKACEIWLSILQLTGKNS